MQARPFLRILPTPGFAILFAAQAALLLAFWGLGDLMTRGLHLPVPAGVFGLFLVIGLLATGWLAPKHLHLAAGWMLGEMLLFFVPAVLAVRDHPEFIGWLGVKLLLIIIGGTVVVMTTTALVVETIVRRITEMESSHD